MAKENGRARWYVKGRREDGREEKDGGGKEESKGKSGCAPPETKSWLHHCPSVRLSHSDTLSKRRKLAS